MSVTLVVAALALSTGVAAWAAEGALQTGRAGHARAASSASQAPSVDPSATLAVKPSNQLLAKVRERRLRAIEARRLREAAQQRREQRASRSVSSSATYSGDPKRIAAALMADRYGWGSDQFSCLAVLWGKESGWDVHAANPSGAYGIPQALPGSKMSAYGADWRDNPKTQIEWGLAYINDSYGTPCGAWDTFQSKGWY